MSTPAGVRRLLLDTSPGERRGVVLLDGRPERLLIERDGEPAVAPLGALFVGRLTTWAGERAFVDLPAGPAGLLRPPPGVRPSAGAAIEVKVIAEAYADKGPRLQWIAAAEGPLRPLAPPRPLLERLRDLAPGARLETGAEAREAADIAQEAAVTVEHRFRGGLTLFIEPTRALTAVDVDLAAGEAAGERRRREANLSAIRHAVRLLRLKALGGVTVIDLLAFPAEDERGLLRAEAVRALAPDGEGVIAVAPDRFGLLHLSRPRRDRPLAEVLLDPDGAPSARTVAQRLLRDFEREVRADPGGRFVAQAPADVIAALARLRGAFGPRLALKEVADARQDAHIAPG